MNGNGEMYWAPTGLADADNPEDIFFGTKSEGGEETANMRIRVGLTSTAGGIGTLAEGNSIMTEKNIESRG